MLEKDEARVCRRSRRVNLYRPAVGSYLRLSRACPSIDTPPPWERRHGSPLSKARERWSFGEPAQVLEGFRVAPRRKPTCNGTPRRECSCRFSKVKRALQALSLRVDDVRHFRRSVSPNARGRRGIGEAGQRRSRRVPVSRCDGNLPATARRGGSASYRFSEVRELAGSFS